MDPVLLKSLIALTPVAMCLAALIWLDVFKLMSLGEVSVLLAGGAIAATASYFVASGYYATDWRSVADLPIGRTDYTRWVGPVVEELLKGSLIVGLFAFNRIGYLVDAAICGFAVGAGFAVAENMLYLYDFLDAGIGVWLVRGFGTAIMHGGSTAIFASAAQLFLARSLRAEARAFRLQPLAFLPGLAAAIVIHAAFNHLPDQPVLAMAVVLLAVPFALMAIFAVGEKRAHRWLAEDRDLHVRLLADLESGAFAHGPHGQALDALAAAKGPDVAAYARLIVQLIVRAETTLQSLQGRESVELGADLRADFERLHALERALGASVAAAVRRHLSLSRNDLWELRELEEDVRKGRP
jgi:RsiW-degrading membrane proteinase PrsW (M82 family)